jgi:hypothetical protein
MFTPVEDDHFCFLLGTLHEVSLSQEIEARDFREKVTELAKTEPDSAKTPSTTRGISDFIFFGLENMPRK